MTKKRWLDLALGVNQFGRTVLVVLCLLAGLPAAAQVSIGDGRIGVDSGNVWSQMVATSVAVYDMTSTTKAGRLTPEGLTVTDGNSGTFLLATGLEFPDLSTQGSAAYSKSETDALLAAVAPVVAWPMVCKTTVDQGILPSDLSYATLFCRSPQSGVPGGDIGSGVGVPSGYFFVVTDVLARCGLGSNCNGVFFRVTRRDNIAREDIETWVFPVSDTTSAGDKLVAVQFAGPLMILEPGDYLVGLASGSQTGGHTVFAQVMGYLTANPERFGR